MFDATQYVSQDQMGSDNVDRSPIPPGKYKAYLANWERRANKAGTGYMLNCEFAVLVGSAKRKVWHNFNFDNPNPKAVEIAYQQFARFALCLGRGSIGSEWDPVELINRPFEAVIDEENGYTRIKYFNELQETAHPMSAMEALTKPAAKAAPAPAPAIEDDEIPF